MSKYNTRRSSTLFAENCLSTRKKSLRQPLQCTKNVMIVYRSIQKSSKNYRDPCPVEINKLSKSSKQKTSEKRRHTVDTVEIDVLSKMSERESPNTAKRVLRSSLKHNVTLHSEEAIAVSENLSEHKSRRKQNILGKKNPQASQILESPNKTERPSFYRSKLSSQSNRKSGEFNEPHNRTESLILSPVLQKSQENVGSTRHSMRLRLQELSKENSGSVELPILPETKRVKSPTVTPKRQKNVEQPGTKVARKLRNLLSPDMLQKTQPTVKKTQYVKKPSQNSKKFKRPKSFPGNIPVDDLAFSPCKNRKTKSDGNRKTKSDGFKLPCRNTLKRKRFIIDAMKRADEEYEDDIYEAKEFNSFKKLFPDSSDSELSYAMTTPKLGFQLTPLIRSRTPVYKDCFSPTEYAVSRKVAEQFLFNRKKRKTNSEEETSGVPEKKKLEFNKVLEDACNVQRVVEKLTEEKSDNEDSYFTDCEI